MNIAFLINDITPSAGTERITISLANLLVKQGHSVTIISCNREFDSPGFEIDSGIAVKYLSYAYRRASRLLNLIGHFRNSIRLRKLMMSETYEVIIGQGFPMSLLLYFLITKSKIIICEHTYFKYYGRFVRFLRNKIYSKFFKIVVLTESDKISYLNSIPNVVKIPNLNSFIANGDYQPASKVIVNLGRLEYEKGCDLLIEAVTPILHKHPDWVLHIYGEGSMRAELNKMIQQRNMQSNIKLCGKTNNVGAAYLSGSIYIMTSRSEGFGLSIVEAATCGLPVIAFDCPNGPREILSPDLGILVPLGDVLGLGAHLEKMIISPDLREMYASQSKLVSLKYGPKQIIEKWNELFDELSNSDYNEK